LLFDHFHSFINEEVICNFQFNLSATDKDIGADGEVVYIIQTGNEDGMFVISSSGILYMTKPLVYGTKQQHHLLVIARDSPERDDPRNANATIIVNVCKHNQQGPMFKEISYSFHVSEDLQIGGSVGKVEAEDADIDCLTYKWSNETGIEQYFSLSENGEISINKTLILVPNGEASFTARLKVVATDCMDQQRSTSVICVITIQKPYVESIPHHGMSNCLMIKTYNNNKRLSQFLQLLIISFL